MRAVPLIRQSENSECGLACVAMIAGYHGNLLDMHAMRRRFEASTRGLTLQHLVEIAHSLKLATRPLRVEIEALKELRLPCILHWDSSHFVVLSRIRHDHVVIYDPAAGKRRVSPGELSRMFTGVALEAWPLSGFQTGSEVNPVGMRELVGSLEGIAPFVSKAVLGALCMEICILSGPFAFQEIVDHVIVKHGGYLLASISALLFLSVGEVCATAARDSATVNLGNRVSISWQVNLIQHLLKLPITYFEKRATGDILSRFDASEIVRGTLTGTMTNVVLSGFVSVIALGAMCLYSRPLVLFVVGATSVCLLTRHLSLEALRERAAEQATSEARVRSHLMETLQGIRPLKLFGREASRAAHWMNQLVEATNARSRVEMLKVWVAAISTSALRMETIAIIGLGAIAVLHGRLTIGSFFAFIAYKDHFNANATSLINSLYDVKALSVHTDRISDIIRQPVEAHSSTPQHQVTPSHSSEAILELDEVSFRYSAVDPWIIKNLSIRVAAGECLAVTGRSGAGKSTLLKLMCGLLTPTSGSVLIGGKAPGVARQSLGVVLQEDSLFSGTISDNIHFFSDDPDAERVCLCARLAAIHEEIVAMPMRYDTIVGTNGAGLSGGQKQRILIARALYVRPAVLVFDESTSHLDLQTERVIATALAQLPMTRIIVAHRPETIKIADRSVDIEQCQPRPDQGFEGLPRIPIITDARLIN